MNWRKPVIIFLLSISKNQIWRYVQEIYRVEKLSTNQLRQYQEQKLKRILLHAANKIPYYKDVLRDTKVVIRNTVNLSRFSLIPVLSKDILDKCFNQLLSNDSFQRKSFENTSGGSTGEPVRFVQDAEYYAWNIANKIYFKMLGGQEIGKRELRLWGAERDIIGHSEKLIDRLKKWLFNRYELNSFRMNEERMSRYAVEWNKYKPNWVEAYAQSIFEFANYLERTGTIMHAPKGIITTAGTLYEPMRTQIEKVFQTKTYNRYGSREVGDMACNCSAQDGLHLSVWNHYFEMLDESLSPVTYPISGKVHVTTLNNYSMPLIRYDIGDLAVPSEKGTCSCGRKTPVIDRVEGRQMSMFKTSDGRLIPGEFFIHFIGVVFNKGYLRKFQAIQKDFDHIQIKVVISNNDMFEENKPQIEKSIKEVMGDQCWIEWLIVSEIETSATGKYAYTICEV